VKKPNTKQGSGVAQVVKHLPFKCEALRSNQFATKKKKKKKTMLFKQHAQNRQILRDKKIN
jgi:hypothetical protein